MGVRAPQGISDPGVALVAAAAEAGITVVPVPGPSAVIAGLVGSGLATDQFQFVGFLPPKAAARKQRLFALSGNPASLVMYVSPHSLRATLEDSVEVLGGQRRCCVSRELTKASSQAGTSHITWSSCPKSVACITLCLCCDWHTHTRTLCRFTRSSGEAHLRRPKRSSQTASHVGRSH